MSLLFDKYFLHFQEYEGGDEAVLPQMFETQVKVLWMEECR